jgi:argininosuccinate lyase
VVFLNALTTPSKRVEGLKLKAGKLRGRFKGALAAEVGRFTTSLEIDKEMILEDIWGSEAHVIMLTEQNIIEKADAGRILKALEKAKNDFIKGRFKLKPGLEDVHMNIEDYVITDAGEELGGKMHTARSRNDQVLTDTRLHLREKILEIEESIVKLQKTFLELARKSTEKVMPGYTHTQQAQPISLGFWATAYVSMLTRDLRRLENAYADVNKNPLGACALAGTSFPIDRDLTTRLLGFDGIEEHSLDAVSSRDFIAETLSALSILMSNLSRLGEELVLFSTREFGIIELSDEFTTGSSIMPQKKNPDVAELVRGMTGSVYGSLTQILVTLKALPLGYSRDLQMDRVLLWNSLEKVNSSLLILEGAIRKAEFNEKRMLELASGNFSTATELANFLVSERGIPFRGSHEIVGRVVKELIKGERDFRDIKDTGDMLKKHGIDIPMKELTDILDPVKALGRNRSPGGTSPGEVRRMIEKMGAGIDIRAEHIKKRKTAIESARKLTEKKIKGI